MSYPNVSVMDIIEDICAETYVAPEYREPPAAWYGAYCTPLAF